MTKFRQSFRDIFIKPPCISLTFPFKTLSSTSTIFWLLVSSFFRVFRLFFVYFIVFLRFHRVFTRFFIFSLLLHVLHSLYSPFSLCTPLHQSYVSLSRTPRESSQIVWSVPTPDRSRALAVLALAHLSASLPLALLRQAENSRREAKIVIRFPKESWKKSKKKQSKKNKEIKLWKSEKELLRKGLLTF